MISGTVNNSVIATSGTIINNVGQHFLNDNSDQNEKLYISENQHKCLQTLVKQVVAMEKLFKSKPRSLRSVWQSLNSYCDAASYKYIEAKNYIKAKTFLKKWIGQLSNELQNKKNYNVNKINTRIKFKFHPVVLILYFSKIINSIIIFISLLLISLNAK